MNQETAKPSKSKKIELVLSQLDSLPTLPAVAARLLRITVKSETESQEVISLIEMDPSLTGKIIAMSTRAYDAVSTRQTASLPKAVR